MKEFAIELKNMKDLFFIPAEDNESTRIKGKLNIWLYLGKDYSPTWNASMAEASLRGGHEFDAQKHINNAMNNRVNAISVVTGEKRFFHANYKIFPRQDPI
jgi:hypothetical protein